MLKKYFKRDNIENQLIALDLKSLYLSMKFDNIYLPFHIINKLVQITESEFGLLIVIQDEKLIIRNMTDISWNDESHKRLLNDKNNFEISIDHSFFRKCMENKNPIISNQWNYVPFLPPGHPAIKRMLLVPVIQKNNLICMIGMCNKFNNYNITNVTDILEICNKLEIDNNIWLSLNEL